MKSGGLDDPVASPNLSAKMLTAKHVEALMSERGRELFDNYVTDTLNHPTLAALSPEGHAENLVAMANAANIPVQAVPGAKPDIVMLVHINGGDGTVGKFSRFVHMLVWPG